MYSAMMLWGTKELILMRKSRKASWKYVILIERVRIWLSEHKE